jgi:hypothetical protein
MTRVRVKGIQRFKHSQSGIWYTYHRKTGMRVHAEFGTAEFFEELAAIERRLKKTAARPGSGMSRSLLKSAKRLMRDESYAASAV